MKRNKFFLSSFLVVCILLSFTACGSKTTQEDSGPLMNTGIDSSSTEDITSQEIVEENDAQLSDGPIFYSGSMKDGFTIYLYSLKNHEWKTLFSYNHNPEKYTFLCGGGFFFDEYRGYINEQLFDSSVSKLAICDTSFGGGESHAGYLDSSGTFTDVSSKVHLSSSDFYSKTINDTCPLFTSTGLFFFYSRSEQLCYYYDLEKDTVAKTVKLETSNAPYLTIFLDGNDNPVTDISHWIDPSTPFEYRLYSNNYHLFGPQDYLHGPNGAVFFTIINPVYENGQYITQCGPGINSPHTPYKSEESYWDSNECAETITSETDYMLNKLACSNSQIVFTGRKDSGDYTLFSMDYDFDSMKPSSPKTICSNIPKDRILLFWKE